MAPRGAFAAIRQLPVKCEAGRARGGARARTFWSSGGLVRWVKRSPARSVLAHPRRRARTPNELFGRPRPKVGAAGGLARERRRVAPTHDRTSAAARAQACVRRRLLSLTTSARLRSNARAPQPGRRPSACFRPPTARLRLRRPSDARSAQRGVDASTAARVRRRRASAAACSLPGSHWRHRLPSADRPAVSEASERRAQRGARCRCQPGFACVAGEGSFCERPQPGCV
jgi:hypothetical protein